MYLSEWAFCELSSNLLLHMSAYIAFEHVFFVKSGLSARVSFLWCIYLRLYDLKSIFCIIEVGYAFTVQFITSFSSLLYHMIVHQ